MTRHCPYCTKPIRSPARGPECRSCRTRIKSRTDRQLGRYIGFQLLKELEGK
jgi:hypothetical protein